MVLSSCAVGILTMVWSGLVRVRARTVPTCTSASSAEHRPGVSVDQHRQNVGGRAVANRDFLALLRIISKRIDDESGSAR
jgi:hypothetical protein